MRILIVCQHFWPENFRINDICKDFLDFEHQVDVLCGIPNYPKGKFFEGYSYFKPRKQDYHGATIFRVGEIPQNKKLGTLAIILNYIYFPFASLFTLPRLLAKNYDLVFLYSLTPIFMSWPGILLAKLKKVPVMMYVLDYWPDSLFSVIKIKNKLIRKFFFAISKWHYKRVDKFITPSNGMIDKFISDFAIDKDKLEFIPQTCDSVYEQQVYSQELHDKYGDKFNFVFAGNIGPAQSLETLIKAVKIIDEGNYTYKNFRFIIIGDGMSKNTILELVTQAKLTDYFEFINFQPIKEILKYHELADCLYVSLTDESLFEIMIPAKIQSYMAAGKPVLASLNGEGAHVIVQSGAGKTCSAMEAQALAKSIIEFTLLDQDNLKQMGEKANLFYRSNYRNDIIRSRLKKELSKFEN